MEDRVVVRSSQRTAGTPGSFRVGVNNSLEAGEYCVDSIQLTVGCYNVSANNGKIYFYENSTAKTATIEPSNYSSDSLPAAVKTAMDTASSGYNTFTVSTDELTGKMTVSASNAFKFMMASNVSNSAARVIGFTQDGSLATSHVADSCWDLAYPQNIFVSIENCAGSVQVGSRSYVLMIPITAGFQSVICQNRRDYETRFRLSRPVQTLTIGLFDEDGKAIDMNGFNWTMTLVRCRC